MRKAISMAINRPAIVEKVMEGEAVMSSQLVADFLFGATKNLKVEPYNPEGAKKLLAEAGYPDGFGVTIHAPNNRYVNDAKIAQTVAQMLTRVGIDTKVVAMPSSTYFTQATDLKFSLMLLGWSTGTGEASSALKALLMTYNKDKGFGTANRGRYSNVKVDNLTEDAMQTVDDPKREAYLQRATEIGINDTGIVPLHFQVNLWATRDGITYVPRTDENTLAWKFTPNEGCDECPSAGLAGDHHARAAFHRQSLVRAGVARRVADDRSVRRRPFCRHRAGQRGRHRRRGASAQRAREGAWGKLAPAERGRLLGKLSRAILDHAEELALIEARDCGKPLKQARADVAALRALLRVLWRRGRQAARRNDPLSGRLHRADVARAAWRHRPHHSVELPVADLRPLGRRRAGGGQRVRGQAGRRCVPVAAARGANWRRRSAFRQARSTS